MMVSLTFGTMETCERFAKKKESQMHIDVMVWLLDLPRSLSMELLVESLIVRVLA